MNWIKENWFKAGILVIGLMIAWSFYQYLVVRPERIELTKSTAEAAERREIEEKRQQRNLSRSTCMLKAELDYNKDFELNSDPAPSAGEGVRTWHSAALRTSVENKLQDAQELCLKQYPVD